MIFTGTVNGHLAFPKEVLKHPVFQLQLLSYDGILKNLALFGQGNVW